MTHLNWYSDNLDSTLCDAQKGSTTRNLKETDCSDCIVRRDFLVRTHSLGEEWIRKIYRNSNPTGCKKIGFMIRDGKPIGFYMSRDFVEDRVLVYLA